MNARTLFLLLAAAPALHAAPGPHVLRYDKPATNWGTEALPLGNGRIGALEFGGVGEDRIILNEISQWTGDENPSGGYKTAGDAPNMFGSYQMLGELKLITGRGEPAFSGEALGKPAESGGAQSIDASRDGDAKTKWCFEHKGQPVIWRCTLPEAQVVSSYTLTSAEDVPARDPQDWKLEGSNDGKTWTTLDSQKLAAPFEQRGQAKTFDSKNRTAFSDYRIVIKPNAAVPHFQVADIALAGVATKTAVPEDYERSLHLGDAVARTSYSLNGTKFTRTILASAAHQVIVVRLEADKPGACTGKLQFIDSHQNPSAANGDAIESSGKFTNGLEWTTRLRAVPQGGRVTANKDGTLAFHGCNSLTLFVAARTNFIQDSKRNWIGDAPKPQAIQDVELAVKKGYAGVVAAHRASFKKFYDRFTLDLGDSSPEVRSLTTDQRLKRYKAGGADPELEAMMVQYGRYLLIGSSADSLPANLQGLWNGTNTPPWAGDYHTNINIQMNYWAAEVTNLSEKHLTLIEYIKQQAPSCREAVLADKKQFPKPVRGWTARTSQNARGGNGWMWNVPSSAWYMLHVWEHYAFTTDQKYLRETAYPMLKEICEFWEDNLKALPDGTLVAPNGWSPEHGPHEDGVTHDQQLIRELFASYIEAADILGVDKPYRDKIAAMKDKLAPNKIGSWGQLMEWSHEIPNLEKSGHRHTSHLFSVYPGRDISVTRTPDLAKAAEVSLTQRSTAPGDSAQSWAWVWRGLMWARFQQGERAHDMVRGELSQTTSPNLFCFAYDSGKPVFQIDGNLGFPATVSEMLVQSHAGEIHLLPALPKAWPNGSVKGIKARGGFTIDLTWEDGQVKNYRLVSTKPQQAKVRIGDEVKTVTSVAR